jgi:glycosyltransferase involved in cell wall biosynthesis
MTANAEQPQVATIIPAYKPKPEYLATVIRALEQQSRVPDEVIVVDDGSPAPVVLPRTRLPIRLIRQENQGVSGARNRGLDETSAPVVHILDQDEDLLPNFYEELLTALPGYDVVFAHMALIDEDGASLEERTWPLPNYRLPTKRQLHSLLETNHISSSGALFRREWVTRVGAFSTDYQVVQDWHFWLRLAAAGARFRQMPIPLGAHRRHSGQISSDAAQDRLLLEAQRMLQELDLPLRAWVARERALANVRLSLAALTCSPEARRVLYRKSLLARPRRTLASMRHQYVSR